MPSIYGLGKYDSGFLKKIFEKSIANKKIIIRNKDSYFNNAVLIKSVIDFFNQLIRNIDNIKDYKFLLGSEKSLTFNQICKNIIKITNSKSEIKFINNFDQLNFNYEIDISAAKKNGFSTLTMNQILKKIGKIYEEKY